MGGEQRVGFLAHIGHSQPACSHVHPMSKEVAFLNTPEKSGTVVGAFAGLILLVAVSGSELCTAAVETEKQDPEVEGAPYNVGVTQGWLEVVVVG